MGPLVGYKKLQTSTAKEKCATKKDILHTFYNTLSDFIKHIFEGRVRVWLLFDTKTKDKDPFWTEV